MKKKLLSFFSLTAIAILAFAATQASRRADAQVLWQDATGVAVTWGSMVGAQEASVAADWKVGDLLQITVKSFDTSIDAWPQVGFKSNIEGWPSIGTFDSSVKNQTMPYVSKFYLTADMVEKLKANQFFISGTAATVTKLEYIKDESGTDYTNAIWIGESTFPAENWWTATAITIDKSSFANAKAGDKVEFRLSAKGSSLALQPFFGGWSGSKIGIGDNPERFTVDGNVVSIILTADEVTALKSGGMVLQAGDCTIRTIALTPMYAVNVKEGIENGTVEVDKATAAEGETVTVTATPAAGYKLCNALARGVTTDVAIEVKNGKFTMPADAVTVSATFAQPEDIAISPESGADIYTALKAATTDAGKVAKSVTINLAKNGTYTLSNPIEGCSNIAIAGPSTLADGENAPVIDAEANTGAFVKMGTPIVAANAKGFYEVDNFAIKNVNVKNIKSYVYDDNKNAFAFAEFAVENCVFEFANTKQDIDAPFRFQAGGPVKFILKNNTMYQKGTYNNRYFVKVSSGNFPDKAFEAFAGPYVWDIEGNTFYQTIAHGDGTKMAFINGGRVGNNFAKTSITIKKNIFIDCAGSESFLKDLFGGKSSDSDRAKFVKIDTDLNTYRTDGTAIDVSKYDKGMILTTDPSFKDAANGDFTLGATTAQARMKTGDPRWLVDYVAPAEAKVQDIEFTAEPGDISRQLTAKKSEIINALNDVGNITINLAANGAYTISNTIEVPAALTIAGPATLTEGQKAPTIDASGLANPFIVLKGSTVKAKKSDDTESTFLWYGNIEVKNVKVSGVAKQFVKTSETARIDRILLENSEVQYAGQVNIFDLGSSFYTDLTIKNSTVWAPTATNHNVYLIKCDGRCENFEKIGDVYPGNVTTSIINSTLYNIARGQKLNNSNGQMKGKTYNVQKMENSILINVGTKAGNEVNGWMFGSNSTNMKMSYANNTYITLSDADEVANVAGWTDATKGGSDQSGTSLTTNPGITYAKAEAGDFTIGASTAQAKMKTGDPRWLVAFTGYTITMGTVTNGTVEAGGTSPYFAGEKVRLTLTPAEGYAIDNKPTFKNDEDVDVTELVTVGQDADGFYLVMPAFNITASYAFSKLYTITLPTETTHGTITIVKPEGTNKSVAGKQIKIKVTDLTDGYKVVAKNGDTDITLNEGDHTTYDYFFEMPEGDVTISIVDATGINAISVDGAADIFADGKPVYNLAGQRVFKGYKGLVIKNGKKVVVK